MKKSLSHLPKHKRAELKLIVERIREVVVRQEIGAKYDHTYNFETCWQIKAVAPISAKDFSVTVGDTPQGFKQLVPLDGQSFAPLVGSKYVIQIKTTNSHVSYCGWWTPGPE